MGKTTTISYATHTWTGIRGCQHATLPDGTAHNGCTFCFAEAFANRNPRVLGQWGTNGTRVLASPSYWRQPLAWDRAAKGVAKPAAGSISGGSEGEGQSDALAAPYRPRVLWDLGDLFENWQGPIHDNLGNVLYSDRQGGNSTQYGDRDGHRLRLTFADVRRDVFDLFDRCPNLDFLLPTKRPQNVRPMWPDPEDFVIGGSTSLRRANCWLLYSASDQATLEAGLPHLLACRDLVPVIGLSLEPLIGPVRLNLCTWENRYLRWILVGGESGPHHRPMQIEWLESIVEQCDAAGVPVFVKQASAAKPGWQVRIPDRLWSRKEFPK
jgi:protein gp37